MIVNISLVLIFELVSWESPPAAAASIIPSIILSVQISNSMSAIKYVGNSTRDGIIKIMKIYILFSQLIRFKNTGCTS